MTVLMTLTGLIVFIFSTFFVPFKVALKRLWMFALTGVLIDMLIISLSLITGFVALH